MCLVGGDGQDLMKLAVPSCVLPKIGLPRSLAAALLHCAWQLQVFSLALDAPLADQEVLFPNHDPQLKQHILIVVVLARFTFIRSHHIHHSHR